MAPGVPSTLLGPRARIIAPMAPPNRSFWPTLAAGGVVGLLVGLGLGTAVIAREPGDSIARQGSASIEQPAVTPTTISSVSLREPSAPPERQVREREPEEIPLVHPGLLVHAREGIRAGWEQSRGDRIGDELLEQGVQTYEGVVIDSPKQIGRRLGQEANEREEQASAGDAFLALFELLQGNEPNLDLVSDAKAYAQLFERTAPESVVDGREIPNELTDGLTLHFPPGVFEVKDFLRSRYPLGKDLTVTGSGMNQTLLLMGDLSARDKLRNFTVRDCTTFSSGGVFDLRREPGSIHMERVRVTGFDTGAGSSSLLSARSAVLLFRECRIEGGYGKSPQHGYVFGGLSEGVLARFESCRISSTRVDVVRLRPADTVVFDGCHLEDIFDDPAAQAEHKKGVAFVNCAILKYDKEVQGWPPPQKDLNDLFPDWKNRVND